MTDKKIKKIIEKAERVSKIDISPENITDVDLDEFSKHKTPIFLCNGEFFRKEKKSEIEWLKTKITTKLEVNSDNLEKRVENIEKWIKNFHKYVTEELNNLKK